MLKSWSDGYANVSYTCFVMEYTFNVWSVLKVLGLVFPTGLMYHLIFVSFFVSLFHDYLFISVSTLVVERPLMVPWIVGSIPHGGPIEPFLVPASAP